jgi:hypothetical protein
MKRLTLVKPDTNKCKKRKRRRQVRIVRK